MARLTAAAGLAWATLLVCVALGAGQAQPQANLAAWFPSGSLPPPVRIYSRQNDALNVAVRRGNVVFARADCSDDSQKWYPLYTSGSFSGRQPFSLVNAKTFQVMTIPSGSGQKVGLSGPTDATRAAREELWTPEKPTRADGFFQLFVTNNPALTLNGLRGVRSGSEVGIFSASPNSLNAIWKITSYPPCLP
ncbi:hypothetical protein PAHAL_6G218700 [Panicum hallii]|uniref:Ricin B lectin domain-containing protein n=1 Tax=Panicum hallii TaxID=206008 RepID=A0A2T8IH66_9POAL|nr:ricin B-like lectin EULS3 [Panicum hallii]XP_025820092.1 ricin B-like lectin EULS3 [Panicum hallii]PVH37010.1 hypothetical protein PAHAL_6G218600 [Panicum hallii]PVH37011.1 hypothetical protein PAHAL_6G218700 [Panicum hallii]